MLAGIRNIIRNVCSRADARESYTFLFFIAVSAVFWLLKTLQQTYETEVPIPLIMTDVPDNVVFTRPLPDTIHVKVRDRGTTLLRTMWDIDDNPIRIAFNAFNTQQPIGNVVVPDIQKRISDHLAPGMNILSVRPDSIGFAYNRGVCRRLPIRIKGEVNTTPQYYLLGLGHSPDSITVYAPQAMLDTMRYVRVQVDGCRSLQADTTVNIRLDGGRDVKYVPDVVKLKARVDLYTEKTVRVPIVGRGFPLNCKLCTFPGMVDITFRVGAANYSNINAEDFDLSVTFDEIMQSKDEGNTRWRVQLSTLPEGASQPRFNPTDVEYLLEVAAPQPTSSPQ